MAPSGPSPKRRRTDNGPVTAEGIARSNATVHVFTGKRQDRWMTGAVPSEADRKGSRRRDGSGAEQTRESNNASGSAEAGRSAPTVPTRSGDQDAVFWEDMENATAALSRTGSTSLVDYESPYAVPSNPGAANAQNGRKSLDAQGTAATTRQGLPSPAPSEENNINSPTLNDGSTAAAPTRRGPGRPRKHPILEPAGSGAPTMIQTQQVPVARSIQQYGVPPPPRRIPSTSVLAVRGSPILHAQTNVPSLLQRQQPTPVTPSPVPGARPVTFVGLPDGAQWPRNAQSLVFVPPPSHAHLPLPHAPAVPSQLHLSQYFNMPDLLKQVDAQLQVLSQRDPGGVVYRHDRGRLDLLREAVQRDDAFYLVLSQLFCLRSTSQSSLPQSIKNVSEVSWRQLESLLCENRSLLAPNVTWFAEFPTGIMTFYSSENTAFKASYEAQVRCVSDFLAKLPQRWQPMTRESVQREGPPLVQDMMEQLSLSSPVLQATAFRAIARMVFAQSQSASVENGLEMLMQLHRADGWQFAQGTRRSAAQKQIAYPAYKLLISRWKAYDGMAKEHEAQQRNTNYAFRGPALAPLQIPAECWAAFGYQVGGGQGAGATNQQQRQERQEQQLRAARQRQGSTSGQPINLSGPQQQVTPAVAQQQAWLRAATTGSPMPGAAVTAPRIDPRLQSPQLQPPSNPPGPQKGRLIPHEKECPRAQPTHPDITRSALHQAHLRSPTFVAAEVTGQKPKLYRYVEACALSPTRIDKDRPTQVMRFELGDDCKDVIPKASYEGVGTAPTETLTEASRQYRLRCCRIDNKTGFPSLSSWVEADNIWPDSAYFDFNGVPLEPRRKLQHGRHLPMDLTQHIKPGPNELRVTINRMSKETAPFDYAVAVELVGVLSHHSIVNGLRTIDAAESLESIKQSLVAPPDSDDDVMMVSSTFTIKLFDPISCGSVFTTPVRGEGCLHRDPFDLETFLSTREPRGREETAPSAVDTWRCPICRRDARPGTLVRDGFLVRVRDELEGKGLLGTKAVVVSADGVWRAKEEERTGVRSPSLEREERAVEGKVAGMGKAKKAVPVVIELD